MKQFTLGVRRPCDGFFQMLKIFRDTAKVQGGARNGRLRSTKAVGDRILLSIYKVTELPLTILDFTGRGIFTQRIRYCHL